MTQKVEPLYRTFQDIDGQPLELGYIYVGTATLAAKTNQITIYSDPELTTALTQPVRTAGGYAMNAGSPTNIYTAVDNFSLDISNKNNTTVYSSGVNSNDYFNLGATGSVTRTVNGKLSDNVVVEDFGAVGDGVTDDLTAFNNAITYCYANGKTLVTGTKTYLLSNTLYLPEVLVATNSFTWQSNGTTILSPLTNPNLTIMATVSNASFKRNIRIYGDLDLKFPSYLASSIGFNLGNQHTCEYGNITVSNAGTGFFCKSVFGTKWGLLKAISCKTGFKTNPLGAGSAGGACTSLVGSIQTEGTPYGIVLEATFYSSFDGYIVGGKLSSSTLVAGDIPIAIDVSGACQSTSLYFGIEDTQGVMLQTLGANNLLDCTINTQLTAANEWDSSVSYNNTTNNALISIGSSDSVSLIQTQVSTGSWLDAAVMDILYVTSDARVTHNGGFLYKKPAQASVNIIAGTSYGYFPIGVRFNEAVPGTSLITSATLPMEGLVMQRIAVLSDTIVTAGGSLTVVYNQALADIPHAVYTQWVTPVVGSETYTNINQANTTASQTQVYSDAPNGYWLNIIVIGKLY